MPTKRTARKVSVADRVTEAAQKAGVRLVRFLYTDNGGVTRGKSTHINFLRNRITDGIGLTRAMQAMNMLDQLAHVEEMGPVGEIRLTPDPDTFRVLPYAPHSAAMTVDMLNHDGTPWASCPRSFLKRQIAACANEGFSVQAAFEIEFSLGVKNPDGTFSPADETLCFSTTGMTVSAQVIDDIIAAFEAQDMQVNQYYPDWVTASRKCRFVTHLLCAPPTIKCFIARRCGMSLTSVVCMLRLRRSRGPIRRVMVRIFTSACGTPRARRL